MDCRIDIIYIVLIVCCAAILANVAGCEREKVKHEARLQALCIEQRGSWQNGRGNEMGVCVFARE